MAARQNIGLSALAEAARLVKPPSCRDLGFALGPRINAGGRVGKSDLGVRLLTCTDPEEARTIAAELDRLNEERRAIEMLVCEQAEAPGARTGGSSVIIVMSGGWHQGVIGIVAGRLKERFGRPAIVIAETEDGTGKGLGPLDLGRRPRRGGARREGERAADRRRRPRDGGGADASRRRPRAVPRLHQRAARRRCRASREATARCCSMRSLAPGGVAGALCDALDTAGPYGAGWPSPRVAAGPVRLLKTGIVGEGHVRGLGCGDDGKSFKWIAFRSAATPLGEALLASGPMRAGGWPARSSATNGTAATRPRCTSRTPRLLDPRRPLA